MTQTTPTFDLLTEPWLPCTDLDGHSVTLGLRGLLRDAHRLRSIDDASPLATFAIYRFLLALVHRIHGSPQNVGEWRPIWSRGAFDATRTDAYLDRWHDRFDLFHPKRPFYQVGGFTILSGNTPAPTAVARLLPERASGNNATLFDHTNDEHPLALTPGQAARALLVAQTWSLGGGKGPTSNRFGEHPYSSHAPCVGGLAVMVMRHCLFETLVANLPVTYNSDANRGDDCAVWERDGYRPPREDTPDGVVDYFTWPARYVRLVPDVREDRLVVAQMHYGQGLVVSREARIKNPFAPLRVPRGEEKGLLSVPLTPDRAVWRDSSALFALPSDDTPDLRPRVLSFAAQLRVQRELGTGVRLSIACFGLANDKAKPLLWRRDDMSAALRLLDDPDAVQCLSDALSNVEEVWTALRDSLRTLAFRCLETEGKSPDPKDVGRLAGRLADRSDFWQAVGRSFPALLIDPTEHARTAWIGNSVTAAERALARVAGFTQGNPARSARALVLARRHFHSAPIVRAARKAARPDVQTEEVQP